MTTSPADFVTLGGIRYRIRDRYDDCYVLTLPYGNIKYIVPVNPNLSRDDKGKFLGLPITKGIKYA